jgi:hypothetical protein
MLLVAQEQLIQVVVVVVLTAVQLQATVVPVL